MSESENSFPPPTDLYNQRTLLYTSCILTAVSTVIIALRMYARIHVIQKVGWTDWTMLFAWVWIVGYLAEILVGYSHGMGLHGQYLNANHMVVFMKVTLAIQVGYYLTQVSIKASILLFYLQLGNHQVLHTLSKLTITLITIAHLTFIIATLTQCIPLHKLWDFTGLVLGTCINSTAFFYTTSTFNIITDFWILFLPVRTLLRIQRPLREKLILVAIFAAGIFACIASIVRLYSIRLYTQSEDPFFDAVPINTWSMVEVNVALICASVPSVKPLLSKGITKRLRGDSYAMSTRERERRGVVVEVEGKWRDGSAGSASTAELNARAGIYKETGVSVSSTRERSFEEV